MILDSGSCTNAASTIVAEKPNDQGKIRVTEQVLIPFFYFQAYENEALYDLVPMEANHLLLGRT